MVPTMDCATTLLLSRLARPKSAIWGGVAGMFGKAVQDALKTADEVGGGGRGGGAAKGGAHSYLYKKKRSYSQAHWYRRHVAEEDLISACPT